MHSSPYQDPPKLRVRTVPGLARPATMLHVGPTDSDYSVENGQALHASNRRGHPPISPARIETDPATPSPVQRPGRGRGRGKWRAQSSETPSVGTRSRTRQAEAAATQPQASRASWPEKPPIRMGGGSPSVVPPVSGAWRSGRGNSRSPRKLNVVSTSEVGKMDSFPDVLVVKKNASVVSLSVGAEERGPY